MKAEMVSKKEKLFYLYKVLNAKHLAKHLSDLSPALSTQQPVEADGSP